MVRAILTPSSSSSTLTGLIRMGFSTWAFSAALRIAAGSKGELGLDGSERRDSERWLSKGWSIRVLTKVVRPVPEAPTG